MLLAEELLLLGLDPERGTLVTGARKQLLYCLSGALIGELTVVGAVQRPGRRFVAVGPAPEHPLLATVHALLAEPTGRWATGQLERVDRAVGGVWSQLVDGLIEQAVLGRRQDRLLFFPVTRHPLLQPVARNEPLQRVRMAATADTGLDARTAIVLALAGPARLLRVIAPDRGDRRHARRRIRMATELTPVAGVVEKVIARNRSHE
jgi:hypothetical protein